jgi:hypothetical protein
LMEHFNPIVFHGADKTQRNGASGVYPSGFLEKGTGTLLPLVMPLQVLCKIFMRHTFDSE